MKPLGSTSNVRDLIPGSPDEITPTIDGLTKLGNSMLRTGDGLRKLDIVDHWSGAAAEAFRAKFEPHPDLWDRYGRAQVDIAAALVPYRDALAHAQRESAEAITTYQLAQEKTQRAAIEYNQKVDLYNGQAMAAALGMAASPPPLPPFVDPGEKGRQEATRILDAARSALSKAADTCHYRIAEIRDQLPEEPGWFERRRMGLVDNLSTLGTQAGDMADGFAESVAGMVQISRAINPLDPYYMTHPEEYTRNLDTILTGIQHAVSHPVDTLKSVVQWDTWADSPGRALGSLLPDVALAAIAGGASVAGSATRGAAGAVSRSLDDVVEAAERTATRHIDDVLDGTHGTGPANSADTPYDWGDFGPQGHGPDRDYISPNYRASDADRAAYRHEYGYKLEDPRLLEQLRARNPAAETIPDEELLGLDRYLGADGIEMNRALQTQDPELLTKYDPAMRNATSAINRLPNHEGVVYKGIDVPPEQLGSLLDKYSPNSNVRDLGFVDAEKNVPTSGNVQFVIESHSGKDLSWMRDPHVGRSDVAFIPDTPFGIRQRYFDPQTQRWYIYLVDKG